MTTGIFFHYQKNERLKDFPEALDGILSNDRVFLYDALYPSKPFSSFDLDPIPLSTIYEVHSFEMVERVMATGEFEGALYSASGTVAAALRIWSGEITNAFVFTGYGDHHAGSNFFGGGYYLNGVAIAIHELRKKYGPRRFTIIDTDAHYGNGTWELFQSEPDVQYICFCRENSETINSNINIHLPSHINDEVYLAWQRKHLKTRF